MKLLPILFCSILLEFVFISAGCRKVMCCSYGFGTVTCIKGTDTIRRFSAGEWTTYTVADTVNQYQGKGYSCNSNVGPGPDNTSTIYGPLNVKKTERGGKYCADPSIYGIPYSTYNTCPN